MEPLCLLQFARPDPARGETLVRQIYADLRRAMTSGAIAVGTRLPSSRHAAEALGVSRNTTNTAYDLLRAEGLIDISPQRRPLVVGRAERQVLGAQPASAQPAQPRANTCWTRNYREQLFIDRSGAMAPGRPDPDLFPHDAWARTLRRASRRVAGASDTHALPALREELAHSLHRDRGMTVDPGQILLTGGTQASLALIALVLARPGETVLIEDPGYMGARAAMMGAGLVPAPLPIDEEGAQLPPAGAEARLLYLCPSNQYPLGQRLSLARRLAFIDHARRSGALILEDDYDSEFHWRGREIPAMHALTSGDEVIYLGTASKSLASSIHLAWMAVPPALVQPLAQAQANLGMRVNLQVQAAFADWLASGEHRANLRRITRTYARRGGMLTERLACTFGKDIALLAPDGGLQLALIFKAGQSEDTALAALHAAGFSPGRLSALCLQAEMTGLVIGFADATPERIERFCDTLARCCLAP